MYRTHLRGNTRAGPSRRSATRFARASSTPRSRRRGGRGSPRTCATTTRPRAARASRRGRRGTIEGRSLLGFRSGRPRGLSPPRAGARSRPRRGRRGFAPRARPRTRRKAWRDARVGGGGWDGVGGRRIRRTRRKGTAERARENRIATRSRENASGGRCDASRRVATRRQPRARDTHIAVRKCSLSGDASTAAAHAGSSTTSRKSTLLPSTASSVTTRTTVSSRNIIAAEPADLNRDAADVNPMPADGRETIRRCDARALRLLIEGAGNSGH